MLANTLAYQQILALQSNNGLLERSNFWLFGEYKNQYNEKMLFIIKIWFVVQNN